MLAYTIRRILYLVPTLFGITLATFFIVNLAPGDPIQVIQGGGQVRISAKAYQEMRKQYGLDQPIHKRYVRWLGNLVRLDFGRSFKEHRPVREVIFWRRILSTVYLNGISFLIAFAIAVPLGLMSASRQGSWFDKLSGTALYILYSLPSFWVALLLITVFSVKLKLFPFIGAVSDDYDALGFAGQVKDRLMHLVLPTICLTYGLLAYLSRFARGVTLEVIRQDYIRTARAKGLDQKTVLYRHVLRNTMVPLVTLLGLVLPGLISGSIIIEKIFSWPGTGSLFIDSALSRDYPVVMGLSFLSATMVLLFTLLADLTYALVDPRIRLK